MIGDVPRQPILITGAAGFIGGEMALRFREHGLRVAGLDLPGRDVRHLKACDIPFVEGDVTSRADCERAIRLARPESIVHCAALMGVQAPPEEYLRVNAGGSETLAAAAAVCGVRRFIYASSVTVHGMPPRAGIREDDPVLSVGLPYADSKIAAESALLRLHERGEISLTILRPGDVYGPRAGEWVVKLVEALRARRMILIAGGRGLVNTTYVDNLTDVAGGCLARDATAGRIYIVTDGEPVTWRRYLESLAEACGARPPRLSIPSAAASAIVPAMEAVFLLLGRKPPLGRIGLRLLTARSSYSIEKVRRDLDWAPAVGFEEGMRRVAAWIRRAMPWEGRR